MSRIETAGNKSGARSVIAAVVATVVFSVICVAVSLAQRLPDGPEPIAWDRAACAHCHMHVGDPRFAAQLQTESGEVLNYDDPGCLLADLAERKPAVHAIWFHDSSGGDRWLRAEEVAFTYAEGTPMGYGIAATPRSSALVGTAAGSSNGSSAGSSNGSLDLAAATELVLQRQAVRR